MTGRFTRARRSVQGAAALLYLALPLLADPRLTGTLAALRVGPVDLVEPAGALSAALAARALPLALALGAAPVVLLAAAAGPVYCAWICPFGLLSEGIDHLRGRGAPPPPLAPARLRATRLGALATLLALSALLGAPLAAILSPPRLVTALPLEAWSGRVFPAVTAALLAALLALELLGPRRLLCRALCPAGAVAALLRRPFTLGPRFAAGACRCAARAPCREACPWGLEPRAPAPPEGCSTCLACVDRCPSAALTVLRRAPR